MPTWNDLFCDPKFIAQTPESEVFKWVQVLEHNFPERPLRLWDICCGAGRHTVALSALGHDIYGSDIAPNGIAHAEQWLSEQNLSAHLKVADMTENPWANLTFHGAMSWDAIYHNTASNIQKAFDVIYDHLVPGGLFLGTLKSTKADLYGTGKQIEPHTFVSTEGSESGVPHHYFDEPEIRALFKKWELLSLCEQVITYAVRAENFLDNNPFPYTTWGVLARKL